MLILQQRYDRNYLTFGLTSVAQWKAVLKVAQKFQSPAIRAMAVDRLNGLVLELSPLDRMVIARQYDIEEWLVSALSGLAVRNTPLEYGEIKRMLPEDVARVTAAREDIALQRTPTAPTSASTFGREDSDHATEAIERSAGLYATARLSSTLMETQAPSSEGHANSLGSPSITRGIRMDSASASAAASQATALDAPEHHTISTQEDERTRARRDSALRALVLSARYSLGGSGA